MKSSLSLIPGMSSNQWPYDPRTGVSFDHLRLETDGLLHNVTTIHCIVAYNTEDTVHVYNDEGIRIRLSRCLICAS